MSSSHNLQFVLLHIVSLFMCSFFSSSFTTDMFPKLPYMSFSGLFHSVSILNNVSPFLYFLLILILFLFHPNLVLYFIGSLFSSLFISVG